MNYTERPAERITPVDGSNDQLLYFTSSSLTSDDASLSIISDRGGCPNVFTQSLSDREPVAGALVRRSANADGYLRAYVYYDGQPYRGLGKASVSLCEVSGDLYFLQGRSICRSTPDGSVASLAEYPSDQVTGFTHASADGMRFCVPTISERAFEGFAADKSKRTFKIDDRVRAEGLSSFLRVYHTRTGEEVLCEPVPEGWVTHVQFSPTNRSLILYNHEHTTIDGGIRRMWLFDGSTHHRLRQEGVGRSRNDWTCHEMWERDGSAVIYHGIYHHGPMNGRAYIGRIQVRSTEAGVELSEPVELPLPEGWIRYGHFTVGRSGVLVSDGYFESPDDSPSFSGRWISRIDVDWSRGEVRWTPLCRSGSSWNSQDSHPHPILDHKDRYAYFTSDVDGTHGVYRVDASPDVASGQTVFLEKQTHERYP
jgi:hypothetical protein